MELQSFKELVLTTANLDADMKMRKKDVEGKKDKIKEYIKDTGMEEEKVEVQGFTMSYVEIPTYKESFSEEVADKIKTLKDEIKDIEKTETNRLVKEKNEGADIEETLTQKLIFTQLKAEEPEAVEA